MDITISNCFLPIDDFDKALDFYSNVLQFEVRNDVGYGDMRWITVGPKGQPGVAVVLEPPLADPNASNADRQAVAELMAKGLYGHGLVLTTSDVDATFEHIRSGGADVLQEPIDQPYGVRDCAFRDPAGNQLRFNQPRNT